MNIPIPLACILMGLLGLSLSLLLIFRSLANKAKLANVAFKASDYWKTDWFTPAASLVSIFMAFLFLPYTPKNFTPVVQLLLFGTIGYFGSDVPARIFGVVNKKLNQAIDVKTSISDAQTGDTDTPTALPKLTPKTEIN